MPIGSHESLAVGDGVKNLTVGHSSIFVLMKVGDTHEAVLSRDAIARSGSAMTDSAMDVETVFAAVQKRGVHFHGNFSDPIATRLATVESVFGLEKIGVEARRSRASHVIVTPKGNCAENRSTHSPMIAKEFALRLPAVARLDLHVQVIFQRPVRARMAATENTDLHRESDYKADANDHPTLHVTAPQKRLPSRRDGSAGQGFP